AKKAATGAEKMGSWSPQDSTRAVVVPRPWNTDRGQRPGVDDRLVRNDATIPGVAEPTVGREPVGSARLRSGRRATRQPSDSDDGRSAHAKRVFGVTLFEKDAYLKPTSQAHPVQRPPDLRQQADHGAVVRAIGPADPLHHASEGSPRGSDQVHVRFHPGLDGRHEGLLEVRKDIPRAIVDQREHLLTLAGVLSDRDIEVRDVG